MTSPVPSSEQRVGTIRSQEPRGHFPSTRRRSARLMDNPGPRAVVGQFPELPNAACTDIAAPDTFFADLGGSYREAKEICVFCPERTACLTFAMDNHELWGVWGGLTPEERFALRTGRSA